MTEYAHATDTGPACEVGWFDEPGAICPKLVEAREGRALADRQLIELTHRVANVMQLLVTRMERQQRRLRQDPTVSDELDGLVASVRASAQLHRFLLPQRTPVQVDLGALLGDLAFAIAGVTGPLCDVDATAVTVPGHVATQPAAAVNEPAWNAHKHAYRGVEGGVIRITCRRDADARLLLSVADQGPGLPTGFDPHASKGIGLMVVYATARQFGGELRVESSERGARFTLVLPIVRSSQMMEAH